MAGIKIESGSNTAGSPNVDENYNLNVNMPATKAKKTRQEAKRSNNR